MPRNLDKLKVDELRQELTEKHGVEVSAVHRAEVELPDGDPMPPGAVVVTPADPEAGTPAIIDRPKPIEDVPKPDLIEEFGGLLDTTTPEEREEFARKAVELENRRAKEAADRAETFKWDGTPGSGMVRRG